MEEVYFSDSSNSDNPHRRSSPLSLAVIQELEETVVNRMHKVAIIMEKETKFIKLGLETLKLSWYDSAIGESLCVRNII